jgi:hypothetical protein
VLLKIYYKHRIIPLISLIVSVSAAVITQAQEQKYHPLESYTVKYRIEGNSTGEKTEYSGDWGKRLCWVEVTQVKVPDGPPIKINENVITSIAGGEQWIVKINLDDNTGTKVKNPMFPEIYKHVKGKDPREFTEEFMTNMGAKRVGEKTVGGEKCAEWEIGEGAGTCITDDLVKLESSLALEKISVKETAVEVKRNAPEPDGICETGSAVITETEIEDQADEEIKVE